jgi:hypothetical protein
LPFDLPLWLLSLILIGAPTGALMLDRIKEYPAPRFFRRQGLPALIVFVILVIYLGHTRDALFQLLLWGAVGGVVGTATLDTVRLLGVKFNAFPVDMPQMFGAMALGVAPKLPKNVMARMVATFADLPDQRRREMMEPRIKAISELPDGERKLFMEMMMNGLGKLPEEKKNRVMKTQLEILSSLPEENRSRMMKTMDSIIMPSPSSNQGGVEPKSPMATFRAGRMPKIPMSMFNSLVGKWGVHTRGGAMDLAAGEAGVSSTSLVFAGYLWHVVNGASYGIAYTLIFGSGSWILAFAWCTFIWLVMMASMPRMMPMVGLPYPRFMLVPLLAHWAMAIPIGYFALAHIGPSVSAGSLLGWLLGR